jgi:replicative DNA helicase
MPLFLKDKIDKIISKNPNADDSEILYQLKQLVHETELQKSFANDTENLSKLLNENISQLKSGSPTSNMIKSGFTDFDKTFGGFSYGEFVVIGGRPSMGKTQLLVNLALNISSNIPVLYLTFDLSKHLLTNRFISSITEIPINKILQNDINEDDKEKLVTAESKLKDYKIFVNDSCNSSLHVLRSVCAKQIQENGVKIIFVDYLQMISSNKYRNSRELEISYISRELKNIAKEFNVCVIASSQLSRAVEQRGGDKKPMLADLRESGAIEQDADKVIFVYRPAYYGLVYDEDGNNVEELTKLILAKNRTGSLGAINLLKDPNFTNYRDFEGFREEFSFSKNRMEELDNPF